MLETFREFSLIGHEEFSPYQLAPVPMVLVDGEGVLLTANTKALAQFPINASSLPSYPHFCEVLEVRNHERFYEQLKVFLEGSGVLPGPLLLHCKRGDDRRLTRSYEMSFAACGNVGRALIYLTDVSERLALEKELRAAKKAAEAANRAKTYFLANMSHEIRTPLGAILGYVDLVTGGEGSAAERLQWSNRIKDNAQNLKLLIDDILDISGLEADQLESRREVIDVDSLLEHVQRSFSPMAARKGLELSLTVESEVPKLLKSDAARVRQILFNLVGNAMKFTEKGRVGLLVKLEQLEKHGIQIVFDIQDTGPGMSRIEAQRLFKPFMQADVKYTRRYGGSGLGLALSQRLARALGGDVYIVSTNRNRGSLFRFELPLHGLKSGYERVSTSGTRRQEPQANPALPNLTGRRVLVVEDSPDNQILVQRMLVKAGAEVVIAVNGQEGVEKALSGDFSIVLMDIQMPVMDGYAAKKKLAEENYDRPVVAFTAHSLSSEVEKAKAAGFHAHLTKPINKDKLYKLVSEFEL